MAIIPEVSDLLKMEPPMFEEAINVASQMSQVDVREVSFYQIVHLTQGGFDKLTRHIKNRRRDKAIRFDIYMLLPNELILMGLNSFNQH